MQHTQTKYIFNNNNNNNNNGLMTELAIVYSLYIEADVM